jgi:hypothetical protein
MLHGRMISTLVVVALIVGGVALADGSGPGSAVATGSGAAAPAPAPAPLPDEMTALQSAASAVQNKDWFMLAGAILAIVIHVARYLLTKKWPRWDESHYGVLLAAALAGVTALAVAWLTPGAEVASSHTLIGALKLFAAATLAYVVPKKVAEGLKNTGTASSLDVKP